MKVQIGIFECTGIMGQDLVHHFIQSTTILCDNYAYYITSQLYSGCMWLMKQVNVYSSTKILRKSEGYRDGIKEKRQDRDGIMELLKFAMPTSR